ncbi:MAG: hypothetical protein IKA00_15855 [Prevotella sp.]|nr:hypothetical protein [Prevotella sp.]
MTIPQIKKGESLAQWRERLARHYDLDAKTQEILREVSVTSYTRGTDNTFEVLKGEGRI